MIEDYLPGELLEEKELLSGKLQIREMSLSESNSKKKVYSLYIITKVSAMSLTSHYKKISFEEYQTYFNLIFDRESFEYLSNVINRRFDSTSQPEL